MGQGCRTGPLVFRWNGSVFALRRGHPQTSIIEMRRASPSALSLGSSPAESSASLSAFTRGLLYVLAMKSSSVYRRPGQSGVAKACPFRPIDGTAGMFNSLKALFRQFDDPALCDSAFSEHFIAVLNHKNNGSISGNVKGSFAPLLPRLRDRSIFSTHSTIFLPLYDGPATNLYCATILSKPTAFLPVVLVACRSVDRSKLEPWV